MTTEIDISRDVMVRFLQGESVLLDLKSQRYFGLDEVGTRILQLLQEHGEPRTVVETMIEEYDVERSELERDLAGFLAELEAAGVVTVRRGSADG